LCEDFLGQAFGKITLDFVYFLVKGEFFRGWLGGKAQIMAAFTAEFVSWKVF
jgi:hypothetical protein